MKSIVCLVVAASYTAICAADPVAIQRCRLLADPSARLKCYDAIPSPQPKPAAEDQNRPAQNPPESSASSSGPKPGAATSRSTADPAAALFGLESRPPPSSITESIESSIAGRFEGWESNSRFRLSNGQVWEIRDGSHAAYDLRDPRVRIVRGFSGTFFMQIQGVSQTPRVRRVE